MIATRAVERGELPTDTEPLEVVRATVAPLYYRLLVAGERAGEEEARRAAAAACAAARAGVFGGSVAGGAHGSVNGGGTAPR